jgi:hypothetical protein
MQEQFHGSLAGILLSRRVHYFPTLVLAAMGTRAVGLFHFMAIRAFGKGGWR